MKKNILIVGFLAVLLLSGNLAVAFELESPGSSFYNNFNNFVYENFFAEESNKNKSLYDELVEKYDYEYSFKKVEKRWHYIPVLVEDYHGFYTYKYLKGKLLNGIVFDSDFEYIFQVSNSLYLILNEKELIKVNSCKELLTLKELINRGRLIYYELEE
ncbi:MAG: hypothetical protein ACQESS_03680 [Bacillota bacterium]